uniref:FixH family protein n=1 Tax=Parerythrobacter lutipelagi TaxID=1964208 RepID=UPI0010F896A3|nr:FixH family protein [Parerythrobacter lutipelagi]
MTREFTGRHMAIILIVGFGIVFAVNIAMATVATRGFGGVTVENSYVASQKFNGWLEQAESDRALGWRARSQRRGDGKLAVFTQEVPAGAQVTAELRRPLGSRERLGLAFEPTAGGAYQSTEAIPAGRWIIRFRIESGDESWFGEERIE